MDAGQSTDTLGILEWDIIGAPAWASLYRGRRELGADDIEIIPQIDPANRREPRPPWWTPGGLSYRIFDVYHKQIALEGGFLISLHSRPTRVRSDLTTFSLAAMRTTAHTRSFEFFAVDGQGVATQPRNGTLRVDVEQGREGWEITRMEFVTDVSLRIRARSQGCLWELIVGAPEDVWRVRILSGSYITWPLVTESVGVARPNYLPEGVSQEKNRSRGVLGREGEQR